MNSNINAMRTALVAGARSAGPYDWFSRAAAIMHTVLGAFLLPFVLIVPITTFILGLLVFVTFGMLLIPLSLIWMIFLGPMIATSWLWIHVPPIRPILLIPGVLYSELAGLFAAMMPEMGEWDWRATKLAMCECWPHSLHIMTGQARQGF